MDQGLIPRRYAKALFEVGAEKNANVALYGLMQNVSTAFAAEPALQAAVTNPFVPADDKERLLTAAAGADAAATPLFADFLSLLRKNDRLDCVRDVANAYVDLYREKNRIYKVTVESAASLAPDVRKRITDLIQKHVGDGTVECDFEVDPKLIGGFRVKVGNELLDASVVTQLNRIRLDLVK